MRGCTETADRSKPLNVTLGCKLYDRMSYGRPWQGGSLVTYVNDAMARMATWWKRSGSLGSSDLVMRGLRLAQMRSQAQEGNGRPTWRAAEIVDSVLIGHDQKVPQTMDDTTKSSTGSIPVA